MGADVFESKLAWDVTLIQFFIFILVNRCFLVVQDFPPPCLLY